MIWKILEIEKTKDEELIKAAYREKLRSVNPEDDQEGFKELRRAFEEAIEYAQMPEEESGEEQVFYGKKNEVDAWLDKVEVVYLDVATRRDVKQWELLFKDSVCDGLDTELEAAEKLLVFFMSHSFLPQNVWMLIDQRFRYRENMQIWMEKFPENYLEYVKWQIENDQFLDFDLFDGKTDDHVDEYINKLYQLRGMIEGGELDDAYQLIKELSRYDIFHPFAKVEEAEYNLAKAKQEDNELSYKEKALEIMEELDFEYSDNGFVERVYGDALAANGQYEKAIEVYDMLYEKDSNSVNALIGKANCIFLMGDPEEAKEQIEDVLEDFVQNTRCLALLDEINEKLVELYREKLHEELNLDILYKLGWCYYQQKKFAEGIDLLDQVEPNEDYDYINLRCRLYLANENYELAYPLAKKWLHLIENTEDDGTRDSFKKLNRLSLANFSLGVCVWEIDYKREENEEEKKKAYEKGVSYLKKSIESEKNELVCLSYMEQLARFCIDAKEYEKAIQLCDEIIRTDRGFFPAYVHRQKANYELRNAKEVIDDFFACKEIFPGYGNPYVLAGNVFYAFEQYEDVRSVISEAKEQEIESDALELLEIRLLHYENYSDENVKKALEQITDLRERVNEKYKQAKKENIDVKALTDIEDFAEIEKEYAILYWDLDDISMTLSIINSYLEENPKCTSMLLLKVDVLNREEQPKEALETCLSLVEVEASLSNRVKLGNCYERVRDYDKAIETYKNVIVEDDENVPAIRRLMYVYSFLSSREHDLDKCKIAIAYATRFIELTGAAEGYVERGSLLIDLYELEDAVLDCKKAIELDDSAYYGYNNLGCALLKLRRTEEAKEPLQHLIETNPDYDHLPYVNLAECFIVEKNYEAAIDLYERVLDKHPRHVGFMEDLASTYAKMGEFEKACQTYLGIPDGFADAYDQYKDGDSYLANVIESYCDVVKVCSEYEEYKVGEKYVKLAMKGLLKYKGVNFPSKIDNIIEFYRDQGDNKTAEKYAKKLLDIAKKRNYNDKNVIFAYTTVLFELEKADLAKKYAHYYLKQLFAKEGSEEELFADRRYNPMHAYNFAVMYICMGDTEKACDYLSRIPDCKQCVMCVTCDCFEYYYGMGLIAELNKRLPEAKMFYEKAIAIKGRYACAKEHLKRVTKKLTEK